MSKYKEIQTEFKNTESLVKALRGMGYEVEVALRKQNVLPLYGYKNDLRDEKAAIRIDRKFVGSASNDIGFAWDEKSGKYNAIVSEFDQERRFGREKMNELKQYYTYHEVSRQAVLKGYSVQVVKDSSSTIRLTLSKI